MRRPLIAGNWKMNGTLAETEDLVGQLLKADLSDEADLLVCPPFTSLETAARLLKGSRIMLGAQDMSEHEVGAYTGDVSGGMLLTVSVTHVILGHSERRQYHGESDRLINAKVKAALEVGLTPVICVGETLQEREANRTEEVVTQQVRGTLEGLKADELEKVVIAYEPVWAIGTGKTATPEMAQEVHGLIRKIVSGMDPQAADGLRILYGGSMKPDNAAGLLKQPDIDGGLIGGASLKADAFAAIVNSV